MSDSATSASGAWSVEQSLGLYGFEAWGRGYFSVNRKGHVVVRPDRRPGRSIDLYEVVQGLTERGITTPVLLRFRDLLASRLRALHDAFAAAIEENEYRGSYACVYPIKVNQQRHVVEHIQRSGRSLGFGLEVGSKPELLAVLAQSRQHRGALQALPFTTADQERFARLAAHSIAEQETIEAADTLPFEEYRKAYLAVEQLSVDGKPVAYPADKEK